MKAKTWKDRIGKRLMKHVAATTERSTLAEVKRNIKSQRKAGDYCSDCDKIALKLGIENGDLS